MLQDVRFALRLLNRHRSYAAMAILTIALGVGANAAVFSIADSVLFRPLLFHDSERLFSLRLGDPTTGDVYGTLPGSAVDAAQATDLFDGIGAASSREWRAYIHGATGLEVLTLTPASREYLQLLGIRPALGRTFDESDSGSRAILLTYRAWRERYGGDATVVGRSVPAILRPTESYPASQPPLRIVGVLPPRARLPLLAPGDGIILDDTKAGGAGRVFAPLVRLRPGVSVRSAQVRLEALQGPELEPGKSVLRLVPVREELAARQAPVLWLLLGAAAIVLLVACVNLANLIIARGSARARELSVRAALGGSPRRLVRLLLAEAACIAAAGTPLSMVFAYWGFHALTGELPPLLATISDPVFDARALIFALIVACLSTAAFSLLPAIRLSRADARGVLRGGFDQPHARGRGRQWLVGLEVATCLTLLVGAGLVGRSLLALGAEDLGFDPHRYVVSFDLPTLVVQRGNTLRTDTIARSAFYIARLRDARSMPGVRAAALASATPFSRMMPDALLTERKGSQAGGVYSVSSGYFQAMGMPLLAGRDLTDDESFGAASVGVLNESAARLLCEGPVNCLGRTIQSPEQPARTVIGVVGDARSSLRRAAVPSMFVPFQSQFALKTLVIDANGAQTSRDVLKRALSVSPDVRVDVQSLDDAREIELSPFRFNAVVVGAFAALTLVLAVIGVCGVMWTIVAERTREYGIRIALGATRRRVNQLVLRQAAIPISIGTAGGLVLAAWGSRFIGTLLYGVMPLDAVSFGLASLVVLGSGLLAAFVPATRAGQVDPIVALRSE